MFKKNRNNNQILTQNINHTLLSNEINSTIISDSSNTSCVINAETENNTIISDSPNTSCVINAETENNTIISDSPITSCVINAETENNTIISDSPITCCVINAETENNTNNDCIINIPDSIVTSDTIEHYQSIDKDDLLFKMIDKESNFKILYFALLVNSDKIKKILELNNIDLSQIFSSDLTFKTEHHVTLWYAASSNIDMIQKYYNDIKNFSSRTFKENSRMQSITITKFSHNSQYSRFNVTFDDSTNLHEFYKGDIKSQPHITLVHPDRDAAGAGTFISTDDIELDIVLETQIAVIVKNNKKIETIKI